MASLIRSAAVPCSGVLTAVRSAQAGRFQFLLSRSGSGRMRPNSVHFFNFGVCSLEGAVDELAHARVLFEVSVDEALSLFLVDADLLRKPERRESIDDAEVHGLGAAAMLAVDFAGGHAEDLRGGEGMYVVAAAVGLDQQRVGREVGEQTQSLICE